MPPKIGTILIKKPQFVACMDDQDREFSGGHIYINNGLIESVGPEPLDRPADEVIDASACVVVPGFVNTHHHLYQTLTRNIPKMQDVALFDWLRDHYEIWRELTEEGVYTSARTGILEMMKSGVTTSADHLYLFPTRTNPELIDAEIQAARELGFRFHPTRGSMSLGRSRGGLPPDDVVQTEKEIRKDTDRLVKKYHDPGPGSMLRIGLAPCSPFSVTPELMRATVAYAQENELRIHTHLAETLDEEQFCQDTYQLRPVDLVEDLGWMTNRSWFAHAVHLNDDEIRRLGTVEAGVAHCPSSNMRLGSGIARVKEMVDAGVQVSLAVDGSSSNDSCNMLSEIRNAVYLSRLREVPLWLSAREALKMATRGGAAVLGRDDIGSLAPGMMADVALFSTAGLEYAGALSDPLAALVFTVRQTPVDIVIINGTIRIRNGSTGIDEESLIKHHNRISLDMLQAAAERTGINFGLRSGGR